MMNPKHEVKENMKAPVIDGEIVYGVQSKILAKCPACGSALKEKARDVSGKWWQLVWSSKALSEDISQLEQQNMILAAKVKLLESLLNKINNNNPGE